MLDPTLAKTLETRRSQFLDFRWLLFIWAGALMLSQPEINKLAPATLALLGLIGLSQLALRFVPLQYMEGMRVLTAIFLLDIVLMVAALELSGQNNRGLMVALSLATVLAALSHKLSFSFLTSIFSAGVYLALQPGAQERLFSSPTETLALLFLFIASSHATLLAAESQEEVEARQALVKGHKQLSKHLNNTFLEIARTCKDLTALLDALPLGTIMLDASGRVRALNDVAEELLGVNRGKALAMSLPEAGLSYLECHVAEAFARPSEDLIAIDIHPLAGSPFPMGLGVYPVFDTDHMERGVLILLVPTGMQPDLDLALKSQSQHWAFARSQSHQPLALAGQVGTGAMSLGALGLTYG